MKNKITVIFFKIWSTNRFSKAKSHVTRPLSANGLLMNYRLYLMPFTKCTVQRRPFNFPDEKCDVQRILRESPPIWASEARRARKCERELLRRGTICGEHNKLRHVCGDSFYALRSPEVPGWNRKFMSDRCTLSFLPQPPPPPLAFASPLVCLSRVCFSRYSKMESLLAG